MQEKMTEKQAQYMAFIECYSTMFGRAPAESDIQKFFRVSPPSVHQMILTLEKKGFISRVPGQSRSISILVDSGDIPKLRRPGD